MTADTTEAREAQARIETLEAALASVRVNLLRDPKKAGAVGEFSAAVLRGDTLLEAVLKAEQHVEPTSQTADTTNDATRNPLWRKVQQVHDDAMRFDWSVEEYRRAMIATLAPSTGDGRDAAQRALIQSPSTTGSFAMSMMAERLDAEAPAIPAGEQGTFTCPVCGKDTPHYHSPQEVERHREDEAWVEKSWQEFRPTVFPDAAARHPATPPSTADTETGEVLPQHIGRLHLGERRSDGERLCSHGHPVAAGQALYWPERMGEYPDDMDPLCLAHAIEQAVDDVADWGGASKVATASTALQDAEAMREGGNRG